MMFAGLWRDQGGMKREPASPGGPRVSPGTLLGVIWGSFRVNFVSVEAHLGSDLVVCSSNYYYYVNYYYYYYQFDDFDYYNILIINDYF